MWTIFVHQFIYILYFLHSIHVGIDRDQPSVNKTVNMFGRLRFRFYEPELS